MWMPFILISAGLLACYDTAKKHSVRDNRVIPVLFLTNAFGTAAFVLALAAAGQLRGALTLAPGDFVRVAVKALIITASWILMFQALRALPLSIVAPIRATAPFWTILGAVLFFHEVPSAVQAAGMTAILAGYWLFSVAGKAEGIVFFKNRGALCAIAGTLLGALSALYDKHLLQECHIDRQAMQLWFSIDLTVIYGVILTARRLAGGHGEAFVWRWSIPAVGMLLIAADWFYFAALSEEGVAISVLSLIRRSSVVLSFAAGAIFFHERNLRKKAVALAAVLIGVALLCLG